MSDSSNLDTITRETFLPQLGTSFTVHLSSGEAITLQLEELKPLGHGVPGGRDPFALTFRHPPLPRNAYLPQSIYPLHHDALGIVELFLVPLGPDAHGMRYEAIFT